MLKLHIALHYRVIAVIKANVILQNINCNLACVHTKPSLILVKSCLNKIFVDLVFFVFTIIFIERRFFMEIRG